VAILSNGLIDEIQREAIDSKSSVSALLRKVKLAAAKLKLDDLAVWVDQELKGYDSDEVPNYRRLSGSPRYWHQRHGWQPLGGDPTIIGTLSDVQFNNSVANIEQLVAGNSSSLISQYPPSILDLLTKSLGTPVAQAGAEISTASAFGILDAVRTAVLDWAIEMEKAGVHGAGMSFSATELQKAQSASQVFNIGTIGSFTGNLGVGNTSADITNAPINIDQVKNLIAQVKSHSKALTNEGVDSAALAKALAAVEGQLGKEKEPSLLRHALNDLEKVMIKATGGLVSAGVVALVHQILGTGVPT
jgi:hypothetical protein